MRQQSLAAQSGFEKYGRKTRRERFLEEMEQIVPWAGVGSAGASRTIRRESNGRPSDGSERSCCGCTFCSSGSTCRDPGGRGGVVRVAGAAALRGRRPGACAGAGRDDDPAASVICWRSTIWAVRCWTR